MSRREKGQITSLDLSDCDFQKLYFVNLLRIVDKLREVILSDTILNPKCRVYCMDNTGQQSARGTFTDDRGIICWPGDGNTPSHAYESRVPRLAW